MTIKEALKKAIEGGFNNLTISQMNLAKEGNLRPEIYLLKPSFWQALGKAMGWKERKYHWSEIQQGEVRYSRNHQCTDKCSPDAWLPTWHRFIDHLASGKDAESFFETLNPPTL